MDNSNRPVSGKSFETEFLTGDSRQKRSSIEMDKSSNSGLQTTLHIKNVKSQNMNVTGMDLASEMNLNANNNNAPSSQTGSVASPRQYDLSDEQKVIDNIDNDIGGGANDDTQSHKSNDTNLSGKLGNKQENKDNDGAPTSWQEIQAGFNRKQSTVRGKASQSKRTVTTDGAHERNNANPNIDTIDEFSIQSQYSASETNIGDTLDDMNDDIKQMKEMLRELLENHNVNNMNGNGAELQRNLAPIYRAIRQIQIMIGKDFDNNMVGNNNNNNGNNNFNNFNNINNNNNRIRNGNNDNDYDHSGYNDNYGQNSYSDHSGSSNDGSGGSSQGGLSSWVNWIFGDLGDSRMNPNKRSLVREYGPPLAFSSIIIAAAYLIIVYHKGYNIFGQPRVLRKK